MNGVTWQIICRKSLHAIWRNGVAKKGPEAALPKRGAIAEPILQAARSRVLVCTGKLIIEIVVGITTFNVIAGRHAKATPSEPMWKVFILVKFDDDDPDTWSELKAYGGSWTRTTNLTHTAHRDSRAKIVVLPDPALATNPRHQETSVQLVTDSSKPFWAHVEGPLMGNPEPGLGFARSWRLDDDDHIEIFYAKSSKRIPRSVRTNDEFDNPIDPAGGRADEVQEQLSHVHIFGRDDPSSTGFHDGDYVRYWHQAEFRIINPKSKSIEAKKRLFLSVEGKYPDYVYKKLEM